MHGSSLDHSRGFLTLLSSAVQVSKLIESGTLPLLYHVSAIIKTQLAQSTCVARSPGLASLCRCCWDLETLLGVTHKFNLILSLDFAPGSSRFVDDIEGLQWNSRFTNLTAKKE
jgi:hypothetical protein